MSIDDTLIEREKTHGSFADHAAITQAIKLVMHDPEYWSKLNDEQKEALDMIAHKIGRIMAGNPNTHDHWYDIAGYSTLVANALES